MQLRTSEGLKVEAGVEGRVHRGHGRLELRPLAGLEGEAGVKGRVLRGLHRL